MIVRSKANTLLEQLFWGETVVGGKTTKNYYYIGLSTTTPDENGNNFTEPAIPQGATDDEGNEIKINEYQRAHLENVIGTADKAIIQNTDIIFFNEAEHYGWGKITHFGIFTSKTGGTPIFWGEIPELEIAKNYIPIFRKGKLKVGLDNDPATA